MPIKYCKKHQINFEENPELFSITAIENTISYKKSRIKKIIEKKMYFM
jgi:hypothetical protein